MADQEETVFLYVGTYADEKTADSDYQLVKELHKAKAVGSYDAVVVLRDVQGNVHVNKDETAFRRGGWGGAAAGAVVGLIFPPAVLGAAAVGAAAGAVGGHLRRGLSRRTSTSSATCSRSERRAWSSSAGPSWPTSSTTAV